MHIVVTGGKGYIGSHIVKELVNKKHHVIVLDWDVAGNIVQDEHVTYITHDYGDPEILKQLFTHYSCMAVIHCAAYIEVGESAKNPQKFYENNVIKSSTLLKSMLEHGVRHIIFSSSCAVYGLPHWTPLTENHPRAPISPYGNSKLMVELMLADYANAYGISYAALRYFNAAGASPEINLGERHLPETHIIPLALRAAHKGIPFTIFGNDYATPDGTCIRDYLHVKDLADAHVRALEYLCAEGNSLECNLGSGIGCSVQELLDTTERITGKKITRTLIARRPGDPDILIADAQHARNLLRWTPRYTVEQCIADAWKFMKKMHNI